MLTEMTYNADMVQMLYKIPSDARVTLRENRRAAVTRLAEHQANYNVACHDLCFPLITCGPPGDEIRMHTAY